MLTAVSVSVCTVLSCLLVIGVVTADQPAIDPAFPGAALGSPPLPRPVNPEHDGRASASDLKHDLKVAAIGHERPDGLGPPITEDEEGQVKGDVLAAALQDEVGLFGQSACSDRSCSEDEDDEDDDGQSSNEETDGNASKEDDAGLPISGNGTSDMSIRFSPAGAFYVMQDERGVVTITLQCDRCESYVIDVTIEVMDTNIALIENNGSSILHLRNDSLYVADVPVYGRFMGKTNVIVYFNYEQGGHRIERVYQVPYVIVVQHERAPIDIIFDNLMTVFLVISTMTFGCELDWQIIKQYLRRPFGIIIGLTCQYGLMPCIAILGDWLFHLPTYMDYGLLAYSCCPGGGASNIYTVLLGGELNLSLIMTFTSTIVSLGMMPLWMYTVGPMFGDGDAQIPFMDIFTSLLLLVGPLIAGLLVGTWLPRVARVFVKTVRPFAMTVYLFLVIAGFYINRFIFQLIADYGFSVAIPSILLPYMGFLLALMAALAFRQPWYRVKTISIETGVQNLTLAIVLLRNSLQSPASALAAVCPVLSGLATPVPILIAFAIRVCMRRCCGCEEDEDEDEIFEKGKNAIPVIGEILEKKRTDSVLTTMTELDPSDLPGWDTKGSAGGSGGVTPTLTKPRTGSFTFPPEILPPGRPRSESFRLYDSGEVEVGVSISNMDPADDRRGRASSVNMPPDYDSIAENVATTAFVSPATSIEDLGGRSRSTSVLMQPDVPLMRGRSDSNLETPGMAMYESRVRSSSVIMQPNPSQDPAGPTTTEPSLQRAESNTAVNAIVTTLKKVGKMLQGDEYELDGTKPKPAKKGRKRSKSKDELDDAACKPGALPQ